MNVATANHCPTWPLMQPRHATLAACEEETDTLLVSDFLHLNHTVLKLSQSANFLLISQMPNAGFGVFVLQANTGIGAGITQANAGIGVDTIQASAAGFGVGITQASAGIGVVQALRLASPKLAQALGLVSSRPLPT